MSYRQRQGKEAKPSFPAILLGAINIGTYVGDNGDNTKTAVQEKDDGSWWNPFDTKWVWNPWTMHGKGGNDTLTGGPKNDNLYGDEGKDKLYGNRGDDYLYGGTEDDELYGEGDKDVLYGEGGSDILNGGSDRDMMYGGPDNDSYFVDNANDTVTEYFNEGIDVVRSSVTFTLGENVEHLVLDNNGSPINGYGNNLDNIIIGNSAANYLSGNYGKDVLAGSDGNDTLVGGNGDDRLIGGTGADTFVFYSPSEGIDTISDWEVGDLIQISGVAFGVTSNDEISQKIFYDGNTGALTTLNGTQFAILENKPVISDIGILIL